MSDYAPVNRHRNSLTARGIDRPLIADWVTEILIDINSDRAAMGEMPWLETRFSGCPPWVGPAWWEVYGQRLRLDRVSGDRWIDSLAAAWCLVRRIDALTIGQVHAQAGRVSQQLGETWFPAIPYTEDF